jgi:FkbM family methyltransferase
MNRRKVALDVGANNGVTSLLFARIFNRVHAFEPNVELISRWERVAPRNVITHPTALSDRQKTAILRIPIRGGVELSGWASLSTPGIPEPDAIRRLEVSCQALDALDISQHPVDFVKIDVEGHELLVLEGARECIARWQPWLVIEAWDRETVISTLAKMNYEVVPLERVLKVPISSANIALRPRSEAVHCR